MSFPGLPTYAAGTTIWKKSIRLRRFKNTPSSAINFRGPIIYLSGSKKNRVMNIPCTEKDSQNREVYKAIELSQKISSPEEQRTPRMHQSSSPEEYKQSDQRSPRPSRYTNYARRPSMVMEHTLIKPMKYREIHQTSMSSNHRVIPDHYKPLEEEKNTNNLDKLHLKNQNIYN